MGEIEKKSGIVLRTRREISLLEEPKALLEKEKIVLSLGCALKW